jgi:hypothetical protein
VWVEISLADPWLLGAELLEVRNAIEEQIEEAGVGDIVGGAWAMEGGRCDYMKVRPSPQPSPRSTEERE